MIDERLARLEDFPMNAEPKDKKPTDELSEEELRPIAGGAASTIGNNLAGGAGGSAGLIGNGGAGGAGGVPSR
jgi:hypothetical protein